MKESDRNSYGNIFKATALFGGVRVFQILINILRAKLIALLIGPMGMGISNLLKSTLDTVNHITGCGLQTSAVRDVAKSYETKNQDRIDVVITSLRLLVWITGIIGTAIVFFGSEYLSVFAFGNHNYSVAFKYLSIVMFATQLNTGQVALLQGTFRYKELARCSIVGNALSLILTIPLYFFFKEKGIVPALIIASLVTLFFSWQASKKVTYHYVRLSLSSLWQESRGMLSLGIVLAIGGLIGNLSSYLMNIFLSHQGTLNDVGLYTAAMTIANSYIFLVMSAMSTDYVPRLSALNGQDNVQNETINKQIVLIMCILLPMIVALMVFSKEVIRILYSSEFMSVTRMLELFMVGMFIQAVTWCLSYAVVARGDSKLFLLTEIYNFIISISLKIIGFLFAGLTGIGVAFIIDYVFEIGLIYYICHKHYHFAFSRESGSIFMIGLLCAFVTLTVITLTSGVPRYILGSLCFILVLCYSYWNLNSKLGLSGKISRLLKR